jgi:hypothetical protein
LIGTISGNDSIRATGDVTLDAASGKSISLSDVRMHTGETYQSCTMTGGTRVDDDNLGLPTEIDVTPPTVPPPPAVPPQVDMLTEAGLLELVRLPEPNWWHFMNAAIEDNKANPARPHMLVEGGAGDTNLNKPGIQFQWLAGTYSTNETVYNGSNAILYIDLLNWHGQKSPFTGTIASKGPIIIEAPGEGWVLDPEHELNLISGTDITFAGQGSTDAQGCHFHFYAVHNIIFQSGTGVQKGATFYGSFTAGNKVEILAGSKQFQDCTFKWSRWGIDPAGWLPTFKVLSWREI